MQIKNMFHKNKLIFLLAMLFVLPAISVYAQDPVNDNQQKFARLLRLIDGYYVDTANVEKLTEKAIEHMLSELDPHSVYISKEEVEKMNEPLKGNFEGIGVSFNIYKDTLMVTTTIPGGPSEEVGLRAGDRIIEVDGENIAGIGLKTSDVFDLLRGEKGTKVEITVLRKSINEKLDFTIVRDKIPIYSLDASYMLDNETGYIKLNKFSATTTDEFAEAVKGLNQKGLKNLVLDLRGNGGGYLKTAIEISDQFLENNQLIVYTSGTNEPKRKYEATSQGTFKKGNLVVLIDEMSASASEIVSGAVQDWDRGVVIGRRSYGKGLVQKPFFLTDGSMVRLTTAHYYTPSGRNIQKPYSEGVEDYRQDYLNRLKKGEMFNAGNIDFADSLKYTTLLNKRTVFGGGGVMPDIFVPMDTSSHYQYYNKLQRNRVIYDFVLDYIDTHREELKNKYTDVDKLKENFVVSDDMIAKIVEKGKEAGIEKDEESLSFVEPAMKRQIKALIAKDIFSLNDYFKIANSDDNAIQKALLVIEDEKEYHSLLVSTD
ncbi:MAG: S41 family peptidase [Prolixibacteraceae bacterium]